MPAQRTKTVLRSIRMRPEMEKLLREDAEAKGLSVNALISSILTKYAEWDRYTEKFGFVTIARNGWRAMLDGLDDESLKRIGREIGLQNPREMTLFWYKRLGLESFLAYLSLISRYGKTIEYEVERKDGDVTILIQHEQGPRYSEFMANFLDSAVREIVGVVPRCQAGRNSIVVKITKG